MLLVHNLQNGHKSETLYQSCTSDAALSMNKSTLVLIDAENLVGGSQQLTCQMCRQISFRISTLVDRSRSLVVSASGPRAHAANGRRTQHLLGSRFHLIRSGVDGADQALVTFARGEDSNCYEDLLIVSGDHAFASLAESFRQNGKSVEVLSRKCCLSGRLRRAATRIHYFSPFSVITGNRKAA